MDCGPTAWQSWAAIVSAADQDFAAHVENQARLDLDNERNLNEKHGARGALSRGREFEAPSVNPRFRP
jgi:hypothetical protein